MTGTPAVSARASGTDLLTEAGRPQGGVDGVVPWRSVATGVVVVVAQRLTSGSRVLDAKGDPREARRSAGAASHGPVARNTLADPWKGSGGTMGDRDGITPRIGSASPEVEPSRCRGRTDVDHEASRTWSRATLASPRETLLSRKINSSTMVGPAGVWSCTESDDPVDSIGGSGRVCRRGRRSPGRVREAGQAGSSWWSLSSSWCRVARSRRVNSSNPSVAEQNDATQQVAAPIVQSFRDLPSTSAGRAHHEKGHHHGVLDPASPRARAGRTRAGRGRCDPLRAALPRANAQRSCALAASRSGVSTASHSLPHRARSDPHGPRRSRGVRELPRMRSNRTRSTTDGGCPGAVGSESPLAKRWATRHTSASRGSGWRSVAPARSSTVRAGRSHASKRIWLTRIEAWRSGREVGRRAVEPRRREKAVTSTAAHG